MLQRSSIAVGGFIEPCLPSPAKTPPPGPDWLHEIKHDGFRILARRDAAGVRLNTRNGHDFTARFPLVVAADRRGGCRSRMGVCECRIPASRHGPAPQDGAADFCGP
jgi:ATP-dependent DNA ligase